MGYGDELFRLDMGEKVKIVHLAEELIRLSVKSPYDDINIEFNGLRHEEKMYDELVLTSDGVMPTNYEKICVARSVTYNPYEIEKRFDQLTETCQSMNVTRVMNVITTLVPKYHVEKNGHISPSDSTIHTKQKVTQIPLTIAKTA